MLRPLPLVLLLSLLASGQAAEQAVNQAFLITGYQPFAGRGRNGSQTVITALRQDPAFAAVTFHVLPVAWTAVDAFAREHLVSAAPRGIIGLGEGHPGFIAIELRARNAAEGADETELLPAAARIATAAPDTTPARIAIDLATLPDLALPVVLSNNPGTYLCNFLLHHATRSAATTAGFIHLPPQGEIDDETYLKHILPPVRAILLANLP